MRNTARFIESFISVLALEAESNGLTEVARLLKIASKEAGDQARLLACDSLPEDDAAALEGRRIH